MKTWLKRALRTTEGPACAADAASGLLLRSGGVWLVAVGAAAVTAWVGSSLAFAGTWGLGLALVAGGVALGLFVRAGVGAGFGLFSMAVGFGALVASVDVGVLEGTAPSFALGFAVAEALAFGARVARREAFAAALGVAGAAATTGGLAWVLDAGIVPATPWGVALGGALAILFSLHARWGEGAVPLRHGAGQVAHAASSRWLEGGRGMLVLLIGFFVADDDFFSPPST